jgi:hypothetical protein
MTTIRHPITGKELRIELASTEQLNAHADEAREFFARVLDFDFDECLVTDESRICDFAPDVPLDELHRRILAAYRVDLSDLGHATIAHVLNEIARRRPTAR